MNGVRRFISGKYELTPIISSHRYGYRDGRGTVFQVSFHLEHYNIHQPLVIDPVLSYSSYLGGSSDENGYGIAVDEAGSIYVTGNTISSDFPLHHAFDSSRSYSGDYEVYVTKIIQTNGVYTYAYSSFLEVAPQKLAVTLP